MDQNIELITFKCQKKNLTQEIKAQAKRCKSSNNKKLQVWTI